ncbi:hypothetical protein [Arthrobacter sp. Helios]|uniref:hypothetical protein n=1 Tax=Arthrobacter sp. Helios TaxID=2828862 RepID=UPI00206F68B1|nr:hypothetical protein [Arthrobacter sp. Helios]UPO78475.1 hypothetical protein ArtHe_07355 [Arthrobacter sp. Helios]
MPGDTVLSGRVRQHTRSILIPASTPDVWTFLNLVGHGRAGWYLLDRLNIGDVRSGDSRGRGPAVPDSRFPGANISDGRFPDASTPDPSTPDPSAIGRRLPGRAEMPLPDVDIGEGIAADIGDEIADLLGTGTGTGTGTGSGSGTGTGRRLRIKEVQPNEWMLWADGNGRSTWLWLLQPVRTGQTRLLVRGRFRYGLRRAGPAALPLDAVDWATMRRCLLGIRDRAVLRSATRPDAG